MAVTDPLLSLAQVARLYGTGLKVVVELVTTGKMPSLDEGRLVSAGKLDVPVIRRSWATALQRSSSGASRRVDRPDSGVHPAVRTALAFHTAMDTADDAVVEQLSSRASREGLSPSDLFDRWWDEIGWVLSEPSGIATGVYSLAPYDAVCVRVIADPPDLPRAVDRPTPTMMLVALPLVQEDGEWRVDLPLFQTRQDWVPLLSEPLSAEGSSDDTSDPADSSP